MCAAMSVYAFAQRCLCVFPSAFFFCSLSECVCVIIMQCDCQSQLLLRPRGCLVFFITLLIACLQIQTQALPLLPSRHHSLRFSPLHSSFHRTLHLSISAPCRSTRPTFCCLPLTPPPSFVSTLPPSGSLHPLPSFLHFISTFIPSCNCRSTH